MSAVKITAIILILFIAMLMKYTSVSAAEDDYKWCAYKLFMNPETWAKARAVCEANGMTLARVTDRAQHSYLTSYFGDQLVKQNPNVQTAAWIGLRKDADGVIRLDDCKAYVADDYIPIQSLQNDCVYFDAKLPTFKAKDCASSMPYLCEAQPVDLNDCFTYKEVSLITPGWNFRKQADLYNRESPADCSSLCDDKCVAFSHGDGQCTLMTRHSCPCYFNGYYHVKGVLNTEDHSRISAGHIDNFCGGQAAAVSSPEIPFTSQQLLVSSSKANIQATSFEAIVQASSPDTIQASSSLVLHPAAMTTEITSSMSSVPNLSVQSDGTTPVINSSPGAFSSLSTAVLAPTSASGTSVVLYPAAMTSSASSVRYRGVESDGTTPVINSASDALTSTDVSAPTTSWTSLSLCFCACRDNVTMSEEELQEKIKEMKSQLSVNKKGLSSWKRKLTSAPDKRTSATGIGVVGILILFIVGGFVMALDVPTFIVGIQRLKEKITKIKSRVDVQVS